MIMHFKTLLMKYIFVGGIYDFFREVQWGEKKHFELCVKENEEKQKVKI